MKLFDFSEFEPFNLLRQSMGAKIWTFDEHFDEGIHISLYEKASLASDYLMLDMAQLSRDVDYRLRYKNANVVLVDEHVFHLAACPEVMAKEGTQKVSWNAHAQSVCLSCLHQMNYEGVNLHKSRRQIHNQRVLHSFDLDKYWQSHPNFPLKTRQIELINRDEQD